MFCLEPNEDRKVKWRVSCLYCKKQSDLTVNNIKTTACLCQRPRALPIHSHAKRGERSRTYQTWLNMMERCNNPRHTAYEYYGGRGISVCDRWRSFSLFLEDMGERPDGKTIDRLNNDMGYTPLNCRWATPAEQQLNRRQPKSLKKKHSNFG